MLNSKNLFSARNVINELIGESINGGINNHLYIVRDYLTKKAEEREELHLTYKNKK